MTESEEYDQKDPSIKDGMSLHMVLVLLAIIMLAALPLISKAYDHARRYSSDRVQYIAAEVDTALKRSTNYPR